MVIDGALLLEIAGKQLTLEKGDNICFDASLPHGMTALNNEPIKFLDVIL
jgi:quercetin dioxygenase-like cupin family protein